MTLSLLLFSFTATAQQTRAYNRFQYHKYTWKVLHTDAFHLYYPAGYDSLASFASVQLPDIIPEVKEATGTAVNSVPSLLIYPSIDQLYESNVGLYDNRLQTFPTINSKGNRVLVAFNGSYENFRTQLKEAWVRLTWEEQFRNNAAEQLTSKRQLMPEWFHQGAIAYFASGWSAAEETALYQYLRNRDTTAVIFLPEAVPGGGKAFCYFLEHRYQQDALQQIFFQLRKGKSLPRAVRLVTKRTLDTLLVQCSRFYHNRFTEMQDRVPADTLTAYLQRRYPGKVFAAQWSPDGAYLFFVMERYHKRVVYLASVKQLQDPRQKLQPFLSYLLPPWLNAYDKDRYPLAAWTEKAKTLAVTMPEKGHLQLKFYNPDGSFRDSRTLYGMDGISTLQEWDHDHWLLSASRRGRSDVVLFDLQKLKYTPLTSGQAEHTEAAFEPSESRLAYRSGYPADSLYHKDTLTRKYGIYYKTVSDDKSASKEPDRMLVKDSAYYTWHHPQWMTPQSLSVLSDINGIMGKDTVSINKVRSDKTDLTTPWLQDYLADIRKKDSIDALLQKAGNKEPSFLEKVLSQGNSRQAAAMQKDILRREVAYAGKKVRPYILQLYSAYFSAQINNDYYINRYQPFQAYLGTFKFPEVGAMAQGGLSDMLEHHHFNIGYQLPAGSEGSNFFVRYENTARRLDWHLLFFRKVESLKPDPDRDWKDEHGNPYPAAAKVKTHYYELGFHYPLHYDWSLDFTTAARSDRTIFLATDRYSLTYEALQTWWSISSLSLGANKLQPTLPMMYKGWSGKITADGMGSTGKASTILYGTHLQLEGHQPLFRGITFVARVQAGYSGGESRILYNFGGTDNNVVPRIDTTVKFAQQAPYAFQSLITPFRGYAQNSLYGSRFGLLNADVYVPLFYRLIPLHTGFSMVNNLQLGLFTDVAAVSGNQGLPATSNHLWSYGFSARTLLAGYPIRFDMAWPGSFSKQPVWYLSLTLQ